MDLGALKVLVVDDQEFVRAIVRKMLEQIGIRQVAEARDGGDGLNAVLGQRPDVVICDVQMRPMNGLEFLKALRDMPQIAATPVLMLTAHTDQATVDGAKALGVDGFLSKPVLPKVLRERIEQALAKVEP